MPKVQRNPDRRAHFTASRRAFRLPGLPGPPEWRDRMRLFERCGEVEKAAGRAGLDADLERLALQVVRARLLCILRGRYGTGFLPPPRLSPDLFERVLAAHPWVARLGDWGRSIVGDSLFAWTAGRAVGWVMPAEALVGLWTSAPDPRLRPFISTADDLYRPEAERVEAYLAWGRAAETAVAEALGALGADSDDPERSVAVPATRDPAAPRRLLDLLARRVVLGESFMDLARRLGEDRYPQPVQRELEAMAKRLGVDIRRSQ